MIMDVKKKDISDNVLLICKENVICELFRIIETIIQRTNTSLCSVGKKQNDLN